jgi:HAMP domain-containing protein
MKLILKFNLVLLLVFAVGFLAAGFVSYRLLQRNAKQEIVENARIMMEAALAVRNYTNTQIKPLLATQNKYSFVPQSVAAYSAAQYFSQLHKKFQDYSYKEAALNPSNPTDRATDWEADIVQRFRDSADLKEVVGERDTPTGRAIYMARPLIIKDEKCLECHDTPDRAPRTMIDQYGNANGFGWKLNDVVAAQIVSAPMQLPVQRANNAFAVFMTSLAAVFALIFLALNLLLVKLVIRPVTQLSYVADELSMGNMDTPEFQLSGEDEIAGLSRSLGRMKKSLIKAMKMLDA